MTFKRTTPITALDLDPTDLPDPSSSSKGGLTLNALRAMRYSGNRVVAMGDSITSANGSSGSNQIANTHQNFAFFNSGGRLRWGGVAGAAGGYTIEQIRDAFVSQVIAYSPQIAACIVLAGTNNVGNTGTFNLATSMTALNQIYTSLMAAGIRPIACTIPPRGDNSTVNGLVDKFNAAVRLNALTLGLDLIDYHKVLTDPATGVYKGGYCLADNIHPSYLGHKKMGEYAASALASKFPALLPYLVEHPVDATDALAAKGLFLTDTNADGVANNWSLIGGGTGQTYSIVTDADGVTKWQRITVPSTATGSGLLQCIVNGVGSPGDVVELTARVQTSGFDAVVTPTSTATWGVEGTLTSAPADINAAAGIYCDVADAVIAQRVTIGAGWTGQIKVNLALNNAPASGSVWAQFANVSVRNLTTLGLAAY
jgi:lysophospholipase L1-like esterase